MYCAGIDPGYGGAIALLPQDSNHDILIFDMPILTTGKNKELDERELIIILSSHDISHAYLEKAHTMPGQGISSSGKYMMLFGQIRGILAALMIPYTLISPQAWKHKIMADMGKDKEASIIRAKQLFPSLNFSRKKDHGRAEALLIAKYGQEYCCK